MFDVYARQGEVIATDLYGAFKNPFGRESTPLTLLIGRRKVKHYLKENISQYEHSVCINTFQNTKQ